MHIFWQKKIRANDGGDASRGTQWWYPSQTGGGELREDRLVFPIMPGVYWRDVGPIVLGPTVLGPTVVEAIGSVAGATGMHPALPDSLRVAVKKVRRAKVGVEAAIARPLVSPRARGGFWAIEEGVVDAYRSPEEPAREARAGKAAGSSAKRAAKRSAIRADEQAGNPAGGSTGGSTGGSAAESTGKSTVEFAGERTGNDTGRSVDAIQSSAKALTAKAPTAIDPRLIAMSRELRDQWMERAEAIVSPIIAKHDVKRIALAPGVANGASAGALNETMDVTADKTLNETLNGAPPLLLEAA